MCATINRLVILSTWALVASFACAQMPVDLNTWTAESYPAVAGFGAGVWTVAPGGGTVTQSVNGQPTMFFSDFTVFNTQVSGQINVTGGDDDFIGFVFGFDPGDSANPNADYLLVDWKRGNQNFNFGAPSCTPGALAPAGLAVSRVTGLPTADEFWGHTDFDDMTCSPLGDGLTELARGINLGGTGWASNTVYTFDFTFNATTFEVYVDGALEISIAGSFANGRLGFYNFSQAGVVYNAFTLTVQCPGSPVRQNYGAGHPGTLGVPSLMLDADPIVGTALNLIGTNSSAGMTTGWLFVADAPASIQFPGFAPTFHVDPFAPTTAVIGFPLAPTGMVLPLVIPLDQALCGVSAWMQFFQYDAGAGMCYSATPGLEMVIGE